MAVLLQQRSAGSRAPCAALLDTLELPRLMTPAAGFSTPCQTPPRSASVISAMSPEVSPLTRLRSATPDPPQLDAVTCSNNTEQYSDRTKPACCRRLAQRFTEELTFRPKLNQTSVKLAARQSRSTRPVVTRLSESRKSKEPRLPDHTFSPKLNALSLKLAHERAGRQEEVEARSAELAAARMSEFYSEYTFRPKMSERSMKIAEGLGVGFLTRQENHLQRRQKMLEDAYHISPPHPSIIVRRTHAPNHFQHQENKVYAAATNESTTDLPCTGGREGVGVGKEHGENEDSKQSQNPCCTPPKLPKKRPRSNTAPSLPTTRLNNHEHDITSLSSRTTPKQDQKRRKKACTTFGTPQKEQPYTLKFRSGDSMQNGYSIPSTPGCGLAGSPGCGLAGSPGCGLVGSPGCGLAGSPGCGVSSRRILGEDFKHFNGSEKMKRVKVVAERIMKSKKVFVVKGGYKTISRGLRRRGWVQLNYKLPSTPAANSDNARRTRSQSVGKGSGGDDSDSCDSDGDDSGGESEEEYDEEDEKQYRMLSYAVRNSDPYFMWTLRKNDIPYRTLKKDQVVNHFNSTYCFTTKVGLCQGLHSLPWYGDTDSQTFFPRCYLLTSEEEREMFIDDYRFTAALCVLKMLLEPTSENSNTITICGPLPSNSHSAPNTPIRTSSRPSSSARPVTPSHRPDVPEEVIDLAIRACEAFLAFVHHEDIDGSQCQLYSKLTDNEWNTLVTHYSMLAHAGGVLTCHSHLILKAEELLFKVSQYCPQLTMDGTRNVWILKPGALSRGRGIVCLNRLEDILATLNSSVQIQQHKWVVQKYIERPLLIYSTKFDIRQWFLVTDWNPLTMWMYKECYLRFSSQLYTLENLDVSVHLCNNSVQRYLHNCDERSSCLPSENMWDSDTFKSYLSDIGEGDKWNSVIYPGMKQAIINVLQVNQEEVEERKLSFELYGADFMITEDYVPWLVEVNCSPTMERNTVVTKRLCKQVMEDTLKVVIDRRVDKDVDTGLFELAYRQPKHDLPQYVGLDLRVEGLAISPQKGGRRSRIPVPSCAGHMATPTVVDINKSLVLSRTQ